MRKSGSKSIISEGKHKRDSWLFFILILGTILRFVHIDTLTEFLGDQGRTAMVMYQWFHAGIFPLAGPTTLTGQHLGPIFYYLLAPAYILGSGTPLALACWMGILGLFAIFVLYQAVQLVYGQNAARAITLLYAVSPAIVTSDRIIWEPNLVPLFAILFAYFAIRQHIKVNFWDNVGLGATSAILVQLHYPNLYFLGLCGVLFVGHSIRVRQWNTIVRGAAGWSLGFLVFSFPFLLYEFGNSFQDIREILGIIGAGSEGISKRTAVYNGINYSNRIIGLILPSLSHSATVVFLVGWVSYFVIQFTSWNIFWTCWYAIGLFIIARYNGVVYDHYLLFLFPPILFGFASFFAWITRFRAYRWIGILIVLLVAVVQLSRSDVGKSGSGDLFRVSRLVDETISDAKGRPFSFTLVSSRSFSDLHFRYFFLKKGVVPVSITGDQYQRLYILCDNTDCPKTSELASSHIRALCYDPHCEGEYPDINVADNFLYESDRSVSWGEGRQSRMYIFDKRQTIPARNPWMKN